MAITREQLEFQIGANAKELIDALDKLKAKTLGLDGATDDLQGSMKELSKTEKEYADAIMKANASAAGGARIFEDLNSSADQLNESMAATNTVLQAMNLPDSELKAFDQAINAVTDSINLFKASITVFGSMKSAIDAVFNPETIALANKLLYILQAYATIKGFDKLAETIETARQKLNLLAEAVDKFRFAAGQGLLETIDRTSALSKAFLVTSSVITSAISAIAAAFAIISGVSIFKTISQDGLNLGKIISGLKDTFAAGFSSIQSNIVKTGSAFAGLKLTIADIYKGLSISGLSLGSFASHLAENDVAALAFVQTLNWTSAGFIALSLAIKIALHAIGSFIESIGDKLISAMDSFAEKFAKSQQVAVQFGFIIENFGKAYGSEFIGTLSQWEDQIASLAKTSTFSATDIRKATKLVVAENQALGLSYDDNVKFLSRAVDIAASSGLELLDVVQRLQSALLGNSTAVGSLGINLSSHALEHSALNKTMQKTVGTMTSLEKQQIVLAEIYRQTDPLVGAAIKQGETIIGINQQIANSYGAMQSKIGAVNVFSIGLSKTYAGILKTFENLPDVFFTTLGALTDILGVTFKVVGITVQWILVIGGLHTAYKLLNIALATNIALQNGLNGIFAKLGLAFSLNVTKVNSAATAFKVLSVILKGGFIALMSNVAHVLGAVAAKFFSVTFAIIKSPLFLGGAAITVGIFALIEALKELNDEFDIISISIGSFSDIGSTISNAFEGLGPIFSASFNVLVQSIKIGILSLAEFYHYTVIAAYALRKFLNPDKAEGYDKVIDASLEKLDTLTAAHERSMDAIAVGFLGANEKIALHAKYLDVAGKATDDLAFKQLQLKKAADAIDINTIRIDIMGTEVEKLTNKYTNATKEVEKFSKEILSSTEVNTEAVKNYQKALEDQASAGFQLDKARKDSLKNLSDITKEVQKNSLKNNDDETKAIVAGFDDRRKSVEELEKTLAHLGPVSTDAAAKIKAAYGAITEAQNLAIAAAKKKREEEGIAETIKVLKEQADALQDILDKNIEIQKFVSSEGLTGRGKIASDLKLELDALDKRLLMEKASWGVNSEIYKSLEAQRELLKQQAAIKTRESPSAAFENMQKVGQDVGKGITGAFQDGFSGMIAGAASIVGSIGTAVSGVIDAINALLDFIPNLLNSVAEIFNKITDFPKVLFDAFQGLFDSVIRMVSDFIPNLIDSIFKSITQIQDFANNLANALDGLAEKLPDIISNLIEKLPDIVVSLFENLSKAWVKIMLAVFVKLPIAIVKGFIEGIKKVAEGIKRLLQGKSFLPKVKIDTDQVQKTMKNIAGTAGRLFSVKDLVEGVKDPMDQIMQGIEDGFNKGANWLKQAWQWVMDKIITPLLEGLKAVWTWVRDKVLMPIWNALKQIVEGAWEFVKALWDALGSVVSAAWSIVVNLWNTLSMVVATAWQFVTDLWDRLAGIVSGAFAWVITNVIEPLMAVGEAIAAPIREAFESIGVVLDHWVIQPLKAITDTFIRIFTTMGEKVDAAFSGVVMFWQNLPGMVTKAFQVVFDFFGNIGQKIVDGIKKAATGGGIQIGGEVGKAAESVKKALGFGLGGQVPLYAAAGVMVPHGTDTVPAMLTPGEFVMSRRGVNTAGLGMLEKINSGQMPTAGNTYNIQFEINVEAKTTMDEGFIRQQLIPKMRENLKRASLDGEFVLSSKGVRA